MEINSVFSLHESRRNHYGATVSFFWYFFFFILSLGMCFSPCENMMKSMVKIWWNCNFSLGMLLFLVNLWKYCENTIWKIWCNTYMVKFFFSRVNLWEEIWWKYGEIYLRVRFHSHHENSHDEKISNEIFLYHPRNFGGVFHFKWGYPKMDGFTMENTLLKWIRNWGTPPFFGLHHYNHYNPIIGEWYFYQ